jgi:hypothetical protein
MKEVEINQRREVEVDTYYKVVGLRSQSLTSYILREMQD